MSLSYSLDDVCEVVRSVAADKILPRFQKLSAGDIHEKSSPTDLVTIADIEAEIELTKLLPKILPNSLVLGEEAVSRGDTAREILHQNDRPVWVVDPVDGTNNFASGKPVFGTMVSLIYRGECVMGLIYQGPTDRMILAQKNSGVMIDGAPLPPLKKMDDGVPFSDMRAFISRKFVPPHMRPHVDARVTQFKDATTFMCCAWEYVMLAEGLAQMSMYKRIEPWDHMAGALIASEAGYTVKKWDGSAYTGQDLSGGLLIAPSEALWQRGYDLLLDIKDME